MTVNNSAFNLDFHPVSKVGNYHLAINFSESTTRPLSVIILSEYDSTITVSSEGEVKKSYTV